MTDDTALRVYLDPASFDKSIWLSAAMNIIVFCVVGTIIAGKWGWDVNDPVMIGTTSDFGLWPSGNTKSRFLDGFWFVASLISYVGHTTSTLIVDLAASIFH